MLGVFLAGAILAAGAPAATPAPADAKPAAAEAKGPVPDPNRIICHSTNLPGSRLVTRKCLTAAAWREQQLRDQQDLNYSQKSQQVMTR